MVDPEKIPYKKGTLAYNLMVDDWSDLTAAQIAEVLDVPYTSILSVTSKIRRETGYIVPYVRLQTNGKPLVQNETQRKDEIYE